MADERNNRIGYTIVELLVAVIIIGILTSIIVPTFMKRAESARVGAALSDLNTLKDALERAEIDTGYLYRLYVLDNNNGGDGISNTVKNLPPYTDVPYNNPDDTWEGILDEPLNAYGNPEQIFVDPEDGDLLSLAMARDIWRFRLTLETETAFNWQGRYLSWKKDENVETKQGGVTYTGDDLGDDPWGYNYLFFTPVGLIDEPDGELIEYDDLTAYRGVSLGNSRFDRFVILSMGKNGLPGDGSNGTRFGDGDDLYVEF